MNSSPKICAWIESRIQMFLWCLIIAKYPIHPSHTLSTSRCPVTASQLRPSMASSARPVGHSSKWSCETLREGYQHVLHELEAAERQAEQEIADSQLTQLTISCCLLLTLQLLQHYFHLFPRCSKIGSTCTICLSGTECNSPSYKEIRGGWACKKKFS